MMRFPNIWENSKWQPVTTNQVWYLTPTSWYSTLSVGYFEGLGYSHKVPFGRQRWQLNIPICRQISVDGRVFRCDAELIKKQTKNIGMRPKQCTSRPHIFFLIVLDGPFLEVQKFCDEPRCIGYPYVFQKLTRGKCIAFRSNLSMKNRVLDPDV